MLTYRYSTILSYYSSLNHRINHPRIEGYEQTRSIQYVNQPEPSLDPVTIYGSTIQLYDMVPIPGEFLRLFMNYIIDTIRRRFHIYRMLVCFQ